MNEKEKPTIHKEILGKVSSLWSMAKKGLDQAGKATDDVQPLEESLTYKQSLVRDYEKAVRKQADKQYGVKDLRNCFFQLQVDQVSSELDRLFEEGLRKIQTGGTKLQANTLWTPYSGSTEGSYSVSNTGDHATAPVKSNPYPEAPAYKAPD